MLAKDEQAKTDLQITRLVKQPMVQAVRNRLPPKAMKLRGVSLP